MSPSPTPSAAPEPDDFALMAAIRAGAPGAFESLAARWRSRLVNFLQSLGADLHGAEDCAQETLLRVYRYRDQYRPDHPFTAFLFTLARHAFLDWRRKTTRWERGVVALPADEPGLAPAANDSASGVGERIDLVEAVAGLPRRLRDVVELGAIRGLPYHQVAALLGLPVGTVKSRMHHAVLALRKVLGDGEAD